MTTSLLTPELAKRVESLFGEFGIIGPDAAVIARAARHWGVGLVDPERHRSWIDERVHHGVLWRLARAERLAGLREPEVEMTAADLGLEARR